MSLNLNKIYFEINQAIKNSQEILLVTHINSDGDALGSILAFYKFLIDQNKKVKMFTPTKPMREFSFLPFIDKIKNGIFPFSYKKFDLIIFLDCGHISRAGIDEYLNLNSNFKTINIDHHPSNNNFADINLVEQRTSSTCEIIFDFFEYLKIKINSQLSTTLLTGIITDTDFFNHPNASSKTIQIASKLVSLGGKNNLILDKVYTKPSIKSLKICGKALSRLKINQETELATTAIFKDDLEEYNAKEKDLVKLNIYLKQLGDVKGSFVLKEQDFGLVKGSLRTTRDDVDVNELAQKFGGGGHKKAAGFKIAGKIVKGKNGEWTIDKKNN